MLRRPAPRKSDNPPTTLEAPENYEWAEQFSANAISLFRYSAVTFNGHRIHYDRDYAQNVEMYPSLVVHGPMLATLLMNSCELHTKKSIATFEYRAKSASFENETLTLKGSLSENGANVFVAGEDNRLVMTGQVTFK